MSSFSKNNLESGVPTKRNPIKTNLMEYRIYGIFYEELLNNDRIAVCAAESGEEAIIFLEDAIKNKGFEMFRGPLKAIAEDTGFTSLKKGLIYGYDGLSRSVL